MAFTANLAVTLWAVLLQRFRKQWVEVTEAADELARSEEIQEELTFRRLRSTIRFWEGAVHWFWVAGLSSGLALALFLYLLRWHAFDVGQSWFCSKEVLWAAAYVSPSIMAVMTAVGLVGKHKVDQQMKEIRLFVEEKEKRGRGVFEQLIRGVLNE